MSERPASDIDAAAVCSLIEAVDAGFQRTPLVGVGEMHWCPEVLEQMFALIEAPAVQAHTQTVVVEFGSERHQGMLDRYLAGEALSDTALSLICEDTLHGVLWSPWVYQQFFEHVRRVNQTLPPSKRWRVLLAEAAFDWQTATETRWQAAMDERDARYADCVTRHVLARDDKALLIFGAMHLIKSTLPDARAPSMGTLLARQLTTLWPVIDGPTHTEATAAWPIGSVIVLDDAPAVGRWPFDGFTRKGQGVGYTRNYCDMLWHAGAFTRTVCLPEGRLSDAGWLERTRARIETRSVERQRQLWQLFPEHVLNELGVALASGSFLESELN
ncbi:hypothetical protein [Larsenimonas salina]|uniref:hypothetical protein n=1 Tax=Larsenimonas salina TaxID=1295565 RepID=UPI002073B596|nr:hypothetical protein [Larsenimonas salina]MCM5703930.1 hypothetical protein [Larsenimonas salina]